MSAPGPGSRVYCTNPWHGHGEHTAACVPPAEPGNLDLRLIRALYGLCPDCNDLQPHTHEQETP